MKLYQQLNKLSKWLKYKATYHEMKYYLKEVMDEKRDTYVKCTFDYDRNTGKSVALARLSAEYSIPIIVPTCRWKDEIEKYIPARLPKYFKHKKPIAIPQNTLLPDMRFKVILVEEGLSKDAIDLANKYSYGKVVGFRNVY
jgi:hypothetical protein